VTSSSRLISARESNWFIGLLPCADAHPSSLSDRLGEQSPQPDQVVGRRMKRKDPIDERTTAMMELRNRPTVFIHPNACSTNFRFR
jgi:hypothetical protein